MPNRTEIDPWHFCAQYHRVPREEGALFGVQMLERLEIQSDEEFRKQHTR
jgi:hypothetical protein